MQESKKAVTIRFYDAELKIFYKGEAFIDTLELTGDVRGFAKMKVSLQPSGPLTAATETAMNIGTEYSNRERGISWNYNTKKVNIFQIDEIEEDSGVVYQPLNLTETKNRITLRPKRALLQCTATQLFSWLRDFNQYAFNNAMVVFTQERGNTSVVVGSGQYVVVANDEDQDGVGVDYLVMSSF